MIHYTSDHPRGIEINQWRVKTTLDEGSVVQMSSPIIREGIDPELVKDPNAGFFETKPHLSILPPSKKER